MSAHPASPFSSHGPTAPRELPLFPLRSVLFPGGLLSLKVFEARYIDLVGSSLRDGTPFGVVNLQQGAETRQPGDAVRFEAIGCEATLIDVQSDQPGILKARCRGGQRFEIITRREQANGLWVAQVQPLSDDADLAPTPEMTQTVVSLAQALKKLHTQGIHPALEPYRYEHAGWVANRWCELLPLSLAARQRLMELPDPAVRLKLVDEFLRSKGVVS